MASEATIPDSLPEGVESFDRDGFAVFKADTFRETERYHSPQDESQSSLAAVRAWENLLSDWPRTQARAGGKLRSLLRKGVPAGLRRELWVNLLGCRQLRQSSTFNYTASVRLIRRELVDIGISEYCLRENHIDWTFLSESDDAASRFPVPSQVIRQITVDVDRTFPDHRLFMEGSLAAKEGRAALFRLLAVYALYNPAVAYCQGMSYIAGMLLMQMGTEEEAFWAMVSLLQKPKYLAGYFDQSLLRIQHHAAVFQKLIAHRLPKFANHLAIVDLHLLTFVTPWFMCLYTSFPCWQTVLSVWDLMLLDGISTIFRVALGVLRLSQDVLLQTTDISKILPHLLHPSPELVRPDVLLPVVWRTTVDKWEIDALQAIVSEEADPRQGRKRRRRIDSEASDSDPVGKRPRNGRSQDESESSIFQRVLGLFRSSTQRTLQYRGPATRSQGARLRAAHVRRQPGGAKALRPHPDPCGQAPRAQLPPVESLCIARGAPGRTPSPPTSRAPHPQQHSAAAADGAPDQGPAPPNSRASRRPQRHPLEDPHAGVRTPDPVPPPANSQAPRPRQRPMEVRQTATDGAPDKAPVPPDSRAPAVATRTSGRNRAAGGRAPDVRGSLVPSSVRWSKPADSPSGPWTSPWREGLKALTFTLPVMEGAMIFGAGQSLGSTSSVEKPPHESQSSQAKPAADSTDANNNNNISDSRDKVAGVIASKRDGKGADRDGKISPCVVATEGDCLGGVLQLDATETGEARTGAVKGVRFSGCGPALRSPLGRVENQRPLNTPSNRRIVSRSAEVQHSFRTFHTPTPRPRSQVSRTVCNPDLSSPEVELKPLDLNPAVAKEVV